MSAERLKDGFTLWGLCGDHDRSRQFRLRLLGMKQGDREIHGGQRVLGFLWPLDDA